MPEQPDWDEDSPQLQKNLQAVLRRIRDKAIQRTRPDIEEARLWQGMTMKGLRVDDPAFIGAFRGEPGLEDIWVEIGDFSGTDPEDVAAELAAFEEKLQPEVARLDRRIKPGSELNPAQLIEIIRLCAWAHAEWVRIHPFANGNGRTARLWANSIALRYGLPPFVRARPRPDGGYARASREAMLGNWQATVQVFLRLYARHIDEVVGT